MAPRKTTVRRDQLGKKSAIRPSITVSATGRTVAVTTIAPRLIDCCDQPMSAPSRWVLLHADVTKVIARRRENFQFLHEQLQDIPGIYASRSHAWVKESAPGYYPVTFDGVSHAHLQLRAVVFRR